MHKMQYDSVMAIPGYSASSLEDQAVLSRKVEQTINNQVLYMAERMPKDGVYNTSYGVSTVFSTLGQPHRSNPRESGRRDGHCKLRLRES